MAGQGRIVMPTVGATGGGGRPAGDTVKLYSSSHRGCYEAGRLDSTSCPGLPSGTGFTSNQRPAVYYRPSLDHIDNPQLGLLLSDNFKSQTKKHYQPHIRSDFWGSLPNVTNKRRESGFYQLRFHPKALFVEDKTEYQSLFVPLRLTPSVSQHSVTVGPKGESGFTEGRDLQFNTFLEKTGCTAEPRQTHSSVMKTDLVRHSFLQGTEAKPGLCRQSSRESGFTRGAISPLACPTSLLPSHLTKSNTPTEKIIGKKEPTGSLVNAPNNLTFPNTPFDCSHFTTHYQRMFCHRADYEKLKSGRVCAGIISAKMDNGYNRRDMDRFIFRG